MPNRRQNNLARPIIALLGVFASMALWPAHVLALGFLIPNQDATAIGRGNAFAATADDPAALYYNPAGISQIPGQDVQIGLLNYFGINATYDSPSGAQTDSKFKNIEVPQIYYTFSPTNLPLSFGLGIYMPFGLSVEWPQDSNLRSLAIDSKLTYITINPVVSWQVTKTLSLAVGPTINYADVKFNRGLVNGVDEFEFSGDDWGAGLTAGLLWKPLPRWAFGVSYRLATDMDFNGTSTYAPAAGGAVYSAGTTADLPFPQIVSAGISFRPTPKWNIEADVDYINWNTIGSVVFSGTSEIFKSNLVLPFNWQDSWQYKFGVTRYFAHGWFASAGYFFSSETTSSEDFSPAVPDTNLHVGSLGIGHEGEHWHWALAAQIITGPARTIDASAGNTDPYTGVSAAGKYQLFVPTASLSVGYRF